MKTVLITGANKSIGYETAKVLLKQGYFVYIGSRDAGKGEEAVLQLKAEGLTEAKAIQLNVTDPESVAAAARQVDQLDILINNAGISGAFPQPAATVDVGVLREVFDTNFFGTIQVTQAFLPLLKQSSAPVIVNVTSGLGSLTLHSDPSWRFYPYKSAGYGPSKSALNAYTISLAYELREAGFKVNAVDPGFTSTDFNHHTGTGTVESAALFVAKYATLQADGPSGKFFSNDYEDMGNESPW
ncbi:SDR family oxidoreductase [uncultured Chitinophaga sp.]|uniref:SDR family oxidoreductase n=1 Tax=uncultured Chitinophaga sp. TaxID=339340 RepID=UPI0025FA79BC|nr:SDR family oxidoreductase [uncultured Chitinophaga sp.]